VTPRISEFYGIVIAMFYNDHSPPHFHAIYGEHRASVSIHPVVVIEGSLPRRAANLVSEWAALHEAELMEDWERAREHLPLEPVPPLD
jgi:hypothetical protein